MSVEFPINFESNVVDALTEIERMQASLNNTADAADRANEAIINGAEQAKRDLSEAADAANDLGTKLTTAKQVQAEAAQKTINLTEQQAKTIAAYANSLVGLRERLKEANDPTLVAVLNAEIKTLQGNIAAIYDRAKPINPIDAEKINTANQQLKETEQTLDKLSDFTFTADFAKPEELEILSNQINATDDAFEQLGVVIDFVKAKMAGMDANSEVYKQLAVDIDTANKVLGRLPNEAGESASSLAELTDKLAYLKDELFGEKDVAKVAALNAEIEQTNTEIKRLSNIGKEGFDEFGNKIVEQKEATVNLQTELENLVQTMARLRIAGEANSEEYATLRDRAAEVRQAVDLTNKEINAGASTTGGFDTLIRATQSLTAGFTVAQGAIGLFGAESENAEKVIQKVTSAMAVLQGLQEIQAELKRQDSIATKAQAAAQALYTTVVGTSTGAMKLFRIALASTGIGLIILAIGALVANWDKITASVKNSLPALNGFGEFFDKVKAKVMGFLSAFLTTITSVFKFMAKLITFDFSGAIDEAKNLGKNIANAYHEGEDKQTAANTLKRQREARERQIKEQEEKLELAKAGGRNTEALERDILNKKILQYDKDTEEYKKAVFEKQKFEAEVGKKRNDEAQKASEKAAQLREKDIQAAKQLAEEKKAIIKEIAAAENDYIARQYTGVQKEYADIQKRYASLREKAQSKKLGKDEINRIDNLEVKEINDATYRDETDLILKYINQQRDAYQAYEKLKTATSKEEADKRYKAEVITFRETLNIQIKLLETKGDLSSVEAERLKSLQKLRDDDSRAVAQKAEQDFSVAYAAAKTFAIKIAEIDRDTDKKKTDLGDSATPAQLAQLDKAAAEAKSKLSAENLMQSEDWVNLFNNLDNLTATQITILLNNIEGKWKDLAKSVSPVDLTAIRNKLQEARTVLIEENPFAEVGKAIADIFKKASDGAGDSAVDIKTKWQNLAKATDKSFAFVNEAVSSLEPMRSSLGETGQLALSMLSNIAGATIGVVSAVGAASKAAITGIKAMEDSTVILAIVQAALVAIQVIISLFDAKDKRIEKSIKGHQDAVRDLQADYRQLERTINKALGESVYKANLNAIENLKQQKIQLQQAAALEAQKKKADQSKINEFINQAKEAQNKIDDITQKLRDDLAQTTAKELSTDLADSLVEAFAKGEDAAKAWGEVSKNVIADIAKEALRKKLLEAPLQGVIDTLLKDIGYEDGKEFTFKGIPEDAEEKFKESIKTLGEGFYSALGAFDELFADDEARAENKKQDKTGIAGAIKGITEQQADLLAGQFGGLRLAQLETNDILRQITTVTNTGLQVFREHSQHLADIATNTAAAVTELRAHLPRLKNIEENTNSNQRAGGL